MLTVSHSVQIQTKESTCSWQAKIQALGMKTWGDECGIARFFFSVECRNCHHVQSESGMLLWEDEGYNFSQNSKDYNPLQAKYLVS